MTLIMVFYNLKPHRCMIQISLEYTMSYQKQKQEKTDPMQYIRGLQMYFLIRHSENSRHQVLAAPTYLPENSRPLLHYQQAQKMHRAFRLLFHLADETNGFSELLHDL